MAIVARAYLDLECNQLGCGDSLSAHTEDAYGSVADLRDDAADHDWQVTAEGDGYCPDHRTDRKDD